MRRLSTCGVLFAALGIVLASCQMMGANMGEVRITAGRETYYADVDNPATIEIENESDRTIYYNCCFGWVLQGVARTDTVEYGPAVCMALCPRELPPGETKRVEIDLESYSREEELKTGPEYSYRVIFQLYRSEKLDELLPEDARRSESFQILSSPGE